MVRDFIFEFDFAFVDDEFGKPDDDMWADYTAANAQDGEEHGANVHMLKELFQEVENRAQEEQKKLPPKKTKPSGPKAETTERTKRWTELKPANLMAKEEDNILRAKPSKGRWSKFLRYGTPASNQALFLVHKMLRDLLNQLQDLAESSGHWNSADQSGESEEYDSGDLE